MVYAGDLGFSVLIFTIYSLRAKPSSQPQPQPPNPNFHAAPHQVLIFTIFAIIAISLILLRRPTELGGNRPLAFASAGFFVSLWIVYVLVSALTTYGYITPPF